MLNKIRLKVIESYTSKYPDPISFKKGDILKIGRKDIEYEGWVRVSTMNNNEGWAPEAYINLRAIPAVAIKNYSAQELTTNVGDILEHIRTVNEWAWVRNSNGGLGWVPSKTVDLLG